ncbi:MAG: cellulase family glycosylhydrolase [Spirochaetes bacterium]|nr:cellulase family glycosylhydrolase [Spirochaetota bacterium]
MKKACIILLAVLMCTSIVPAAPVLVSGVDISKWRGFNLTEQYNVGKEKPFLESDFKLISELGFNFVRLPVDYRIYDDTNNPRSYKEDKLKALDEAVEFGEKYKIHVCINLHKAPGFCINKTVGINDELWTDAATQDYFVDYWVMLTKRYKKYSAERVSLNLLNEPARTKPEIFLPLMQRVVKAINEADPKRLIVMDAYNVGAVPMAELYKMNNVVTAIRGYAPGNLTHYKAEWVKGSDTYAVPEWPVACKVGAYLYAPSKTDVPNGPAVIRGKFPAGTKVVVNVAQVSKKADFKVKSDDAVIFEKIFEPKDGAGEWKEVVYKKEYDMYQNKYDKEYTTAAVTKDASTLTLVNTDGDWMRLNGIKIQFPAGKEVQLQTEFAWGRKHADYILDANGRLSAEGFDGEYPVKNFLAPWKDAITNGAKVFVGEMGAYKYTPHDVTLRWFETCLSQYKSMNIGWALWSFRGGGFGPIDSGRKDVQFEEKDGMKIDRKMMDLLIKYRNY